MTISVADFRARFCEFSDSKEYSDARVQIFIDDAALLYLGMDEARWAGKYDIAQSYLAAHLLAVNDKSALGDSASQAGPVSSVSAGGVSVTRATQTKDRSDTNEFFMSTTYGQQFLSIRNSCFAGVAVANCL